MKTPRRDTTTYGFAQTSSLLQGRIRKASESRGFAVSRVLTHWPEIVGEATAAIARPVEVGYGRGGLGATLTILTTGPHAPMVEMQKAAIRDKVNACYGYNAISRIRITQTAPTGFAEGQASFAGRARPAAPAARPPSPEASALARDVADTELRLAIEALAANVLSRRKT